MSDVVLAAIVGVLGGAGGALIGVVVSWRQDVLRHERASEAEREARVRAARLVALDQTRNYLIDHLVWLQAFVLLRDRSAKSAQSGSNKRANINLVGDADVIREYSDVVRELSGQIPMRWREALPYWKPRTLAEVNPDELGRVNRVWSRLLEALDAQEELVLRDRQPKALTNEELASLPGAEAMLEMLRSRSQGR
jgi:hypothetical protein